MNLKEFRTDGVASSGATRQVLTFALGQEVYGVDILRVKEIRGWTPVTRIPHSPPSVLGMLNLRGAIVPIIDLRVQFAMPSAEFNAITVVIVLSLRTAEGQRECGIVVDSVRDVVDIATDSIRPAPSMHGRDATGFIDGITTTDDQMLLLFNADYLLSGDLSPAASTTEAA
jgi:purine-binding chemotaxis protein CheW